MLNSKADAEGITLADGLDETISQGGAARGQAPGSGSRAPEGAVLPDGGERARRTVARMDSKTLELAYSFRVISSKASNPGNLVNDSVTACWLQRCSGNASCAPAITPSVPTLVPTVPTNADTSSGAGRFTRMPTPPVHIAGGVGARGHLDAARGEGLAEIGPACRRQPLDDSALRQRLALHGQPAPARPHSGRSRRCRPPGLDPAKVRLGSESVGFAPREPSPKGARTLVSYRAQRADRCRTGQLRLALGAAIRRR